MPRSPKPNPKPTGIEALVCAEITKRQQFGIQKYGRTVAQNRARRLARLTHAFQEAMDLAVYLQWEIEKEKARLKRAKRRPRR